MVIMKRLIFFLPVVFLLLFSNCEKEPTIECEITYEISSQTLENGDHLLISGFNITPISPLSGIDIQKIEFYLGNKKIGTCNFPPYELDYEIPNLPTGNHLLQIDVYLAANGYDDTTYWLRKNIKIIKPQITE